MRTSPLLVLLASAAACGGTPQPETHAATAMAAPVATAAGAQPLTAPKLRLPTTVRPQSYAVAMRMSPSEETFTGTVDVDIDIAEATNVVWMHAGDNLKIVRRRSRVPRPRAHASSARTMASSGRWSEASRRATTR